MKKTFSELKKEALNIAKSFPNQWDLTTHCVDLMEEVGELANAVLIETKQKSKKRQRAHLEDSFADVLFELILMADEANIDLEEVLAQMLSELKARIKNNEYKNI
ncbi:MAG: MazG nucleotide pyrophosphohydrolase domain-containing protein [Candidatus Woesebacteria bacterium]|jgi:NTP pyrophosphatase (non-canonical NTP hydrolase)